MSSTESREQGDVCGHPLFSELPGENLAERYDVNTWYEDGNGIHHCQREVWEDADTERCIWHADIDGKSVEALSAAREQDPERLDRAVLREVKFEKGFSFAGCRLIESDFTSGRGKNVDFASANMAEAKLANADLRSSNFVNADLSFANLAGADFSGVDLIEADLQGAHLHSASLGAADLSHTNLVNTDLTDAILGSADFTGAHLNGADMTNADLRAAVMTDADLRSTLLIQTDIRRTTFERAELYHTVFENTRIDDTTSFGDECAYENLEAEIDTGDTGIDDSAEAATWVYRRLETLHEDNAMADRARHYHIRKEEAQRRQHWQDGNYLRWAVGTANRYLTKHGESLAHILGWSAVVIVGSSLLYPFVGGIIDGGQRYRLTELTQLFTPEGLTTLARSLYFSTITFSTIGYANVSPAGAGSRVLVGVESLLGALLMALFVFVLARRVAR